MIALSRVARALSFVLVSTAAVQSAAAVQDCNFTTYPGVQKMRQVDGSEIELVFRGNARNHWYEDVAGYPVVDSGSGFFFARRAADGSLAATEWLVGAADPASLDLERRIVPVPREQSQGPGAPDAVTSKRHAGAAAPQSRPGGPFLGSSSVKNLVVLLRFADHGPSGQNRTLPSTADVATIMNAVGGDPTLAPTGSVRDHYLETSYNQFTINSTVVGWLDVPNDETYYANGNSGLTTLTWDLITDGLALADATIDFGDFDEDGDGWVDAITFLHSGYGAEWGGNDQYGTNYVDRMWSHKWTIPTWTSAEGVKVGDYNISPGLWGTSGSSAGRIGVVCHELGHFFGLPDLYDTDGTSEGAGNWCLMAGGAWGFDGSQQYPSHMSAWSKLKLGWVSPQRLLPGSHSAAEVETNQAVYMIDSGYPQGEYLLVENRQQVGFDGVIPQGGLAIWHVDESKGSFTNDDPNTDEGYPGQGGWPGNNNHYRAAMLQADAGFDMEQGFDRGDGGDVYRSGFATTIDSATTPNTSAYQGGSIVTNSNRLQGIGASSSNMAFTYVNTGAPTITTASAPLAKVGVPYMATFTRSGGTAPYAWSEFRDNPSYALADLGPTSFTAGGTAQGWNSDETVTTLNLSFRFPYYEQDYTKVYVTPNGMIEFAPAEFEFYNTVPSLRCLAHIAAMWDDLRTDAAVGEDVYVDTSVSNQVRIRWQAETWNGAAPSNFAITLHADGRIRFDYGSGNTSLTPTVGISRGHSGDLTVADTHDAQPSLTNANSLEFTLQGSEIPPGLSLSSGGVLSGTPTTAGSYALRVRVTDALFRYDQKLLTVNVIVDCNGNDIADAVDISGGGSDDDNSNGVPDECESVDAVSYCFGDGIDPVVTADCPCTNFGAAGRGCANSFTSAGGLLDVSGTQIPNTVLFTATGLPNNNLCVFLRGTVNVPAGALFGDGISCVGGTLLRFGQQTIASHEATAGTPTVAPGNTRYYVLQYRNPAPTFCPTATFNATNGIMVNW